MVQLACKYQEPGYCHKILDMVPDIIDKFTGKSGNVTTDDDINDAIDGVAKEFE